MAATKKRSVARAKSKPANDAIVRATRQALAKLRAEHARRRADHEDIVADAHAYCVPRWDGETPYEAFVTWKAGKIAIDRSRKEKRRSEAVETSSVERPATIEGVRAAAIAECRRRVRAAMGDDDEADRWIADFASSLDVVEDQAAGAKAARKILKSLEDAPAWVVARVDVPALTQYARRGYYEPWRRFLNGWRGIIVRASNGKVERFGATDTERAVMSLLSGCWPKIRAGMSAAEVIEEEAERIARAEVKPRKSH